MATSKNDDEGTGKKDSTTALDLSKLVITTKEEFKKLLDKVPDYKMKPEKIRKEDIKFHDKDFKFKTGKKDYKAMRAPYTFIDPLPPDMSSLNVADFAPVPIDWKMLTTVRPKTKVEEDMFSRLVELGKLQLKTVQSDKRAALLNPPIRKTKNKAGVIECRALSCPLCGEEFCNGKACTQTNYDSFARVEVPEKLKKPSSKGLPLLEQTKKGKKKKGKSKRKSRSKSKASRSKSEKRKSSKSPRKKSKSPRKSAEIKN